MTKIKDIRMNKKKDGVVVAFDKWPEKSWVFPINQIKNTEGFRRKLEETVRLNEQLDEPEPFDEDKFNKLKELIGVEV